MGRMILYRNILFFDMAVFRFSILDALCVSSGEEDGLISGWAEMHTHGTGCKLLNIQMKPG